MNNTCLTTQNLKNLVINPEPFASNKSHSFLILIHYLLKNLTYTIITSQSTQNSIRHNLSLHSKFKRVQNEGTGKSSWWTINYEAKNSRPARPRQKQLKGGGGGGDIQRSNTMDSSLLCGKKGSKKEGRIRKKVFVFLIKINMFFEYVFTVF